MANEITTTTADDLSIAAELLAADILDAFTGLNTAGGMVRMANIAGAPTKAKDFPITPTLSASGLAEGVDMVNTAFMTTKATITVGEVGLMITPTDLLSASDIVEDGYYASVASRALASKVTTDIASLGSGFSQQCGATTVNLTEANIMAGLVILKSAGVPGPYRGLLHPAQYQDLATSIGSTLTTYGRGGTDVRAVGNELLGQVDGALGRALGIDWYETHLVPTATAGADRLGMIVNVQNALGFVSKWEARVELQRDASLRAREIVITACYGVGELRDNAGLGVLSDA
jgi:hypothetical protein